MNTRWGGFLNGIDQFDAEFFGITSPQATEMDPQQRLVLEVAWRAFENAGLSIDKLNGSDTGVFVGLSTNDYMHLQIKLKPDLKDYNAYSGLGNANSLSANQLSYIFNLRGPSVTVDTACSSSLTSVHLAARSLRQGECEIAIAGGVNALISPGTTVTLSQFNMMSPAGRCKVFDSSADGYVRSEGCGLVVLKRRSDAVRDGDHIIAYLLGSAIGQNGRTTVITAPNAAAQREVIQKALADAHCRPEDVTVVEAHGTGTIVGDPAEVEQIKNVYGGPSPAGLCYLGSVKANVGHLESAAGIAGLIKLILCVQHGEIPPQIHLLYRTARSVGPPAEAGSARSAHSASAAQTRTQLSRQTATRQTTPLLKKLGQRRSCFHFRQEMKLLCAIRTPPGCVIFDTQKTIRLRRSRIRSPCGVRISSTAITTSLARAKSWLRNSSRHRNRDIQATNTTLRSVFYSAARARNTPA